MLHRFSKLVAACTLLLIVAGGMVTSTGSGLAVPDWPSSYGYFMFSFPLSYMVGGIFYEHGHRLIASTVGLLMIVLAAWLWWTERGVGVPAEAGRGRDPGLNTERGVGVPAEAGRGRDPGLNKEPRRWLARLGLIALAAVTVQGVLGGITVLWFLPAPVSIAHAGLAQIFFCLTVSIALFTSPSWLDGYPTPGVYGGVGLERAGAGPRAPLEPDRGLRRLSTPGVADGILRRLTVVTTGMIYIQILMGATMRHTGAGLAIPDFPWAFGHLVPPVWTAPIAVNFAHRLGAVAVLCAILATAGRVLHHHRARGELRRPAVMLVLLVVVQITLGAWTILSAKAPVINTAHVATGALVLATSLILTLRAHRIRFAQAFASAQIAARRPLVRPETSVGVRA